MNLEKWRLDDFVKYLTAAEDATIDAYRGDLMGFIAWSHDLGHSDPQAIGRREVRSWVADMSREGYARSTIARQLSALRRYFGWLKQDGRIGLNPTVHISAPTGDARLPRVLQLGEIEQLFDDTTPENSLE
ncbi:MAG: site-specific integrase, partial [Actinomycetota bacterium]|nr:site-specific integrase [Actinomycetota bacterium]